MPVGTFASAVHVAAGPTYGAEQRVTVGGAANSVHTGGLEFGISVQFARAGRITKIRWWQRFSGGAQQINLRVWSTAGALLAGPIFSINTGGLTEQWITQPLSTPVLVAAGSTQVFSMSWASGAGGNGIPLHSGVLDTFTNTTDCTGINVCLVNTTGAGLFPNISGGSSVYVEPFYEPQL